MEQMEICRTVMGRLPCTRLLSRWVTVCVFLALCVPAAPSIPALVAAQQVKRLSACAWHWSVSLAQQLHEAALSG